MKTWGVSKILLKAALALLGVAMMFAFVALYLALSVVFAI